MSKQEFLEYLRKGLSGLPQEDIEERLTFYGEMIDDRIEEGLTEEDAVSRIGTVDTIIPQIKADIPITKLVREKITPKKNLRIWEIVLLILGSPIWLSLLITAFAVILSLYASLWSVVISLWAVFGLVIGCAFGSVVAGIVFACSGNVLSGIAMLAAGIICAGLSIFMFYGCKAATNGVLMLTKKMALGIKSLFVVKEAAK